MRVATIDIGTNSVLMLIAEPIPDQPNNLKPLLELSTITRLGQEVDETQRLHPDAVFRTLSCLKEYGNQLRHWGVSRVDMVSTSATRNVDGADDFVRQAERVVGVRPRIITGEQEACLSFQGAVVGLSVQGPVAVFDIGGGSTEVVFGHREQQQMPTVTRATSINIGCVRLTERHVQNDPPSQSELTAVRESADNALRAMSPFKEKCTWIGIGGTITALLAVDKGLEQYSSQRIHGATITRQNIRQLAHQLGAMPLCERNEVVGLDPKRADVIVTGAILAHSLLTWANAEQALVSDRGVRWGLALELCSSTL